MTDKNVPPQSGGWKRTIRKGIFILALFFVAVVGLLFFIDRSPIPTSGEPSSQRPIESPLGVKKSGTSDALAVAQRQGRCRALKYHLNEMANAQSESDVEAKRGALGLLSGEMMNAYPRNAGTGPTSNALPVVNTPEGHRRLNEARDAFQETLRSVKGMNGKQAAAKIAESCLACHSRFLREGSPVISLLGNATSSQ